MAATTRQTFGETEFAPPADGQPGTSSGSSQAGIDTPRSSPTPTQVADEWGERLGHAAAHLVSGIGRTANGLARSATNASRRPDSGDGDTTSAVPGSATRRADQLVDRLAAQIGPYAEIAGFKVKQWLARAQEEAEDIWAEA